MHLVSLACGERHAIVVYLQEDVRGLRLVAWRIVPSTTRPAVKSDVEHALQM